MIMTRKLTNRIVLLAAALLLCLSVNAQTPPATWQEHWFEHNQVLNRVYYDNDLAVYYDNNVSPTITWPFQYMGDVWRYTKSVYGNYGTENRLYAIFHTGRYSGGHPSSYFDPSHDNRNVTDCGPGPWTSGSGNDLDLNTHEVSHIVEGASKGIHGSPHRPLWGDSKWAEIFNYDVYVGLGRTSDVTRWYNLMINSNDNFPRANTYWFRDWFYPIYANHGGSALLNNYYVLLAQHFPKNGNSYARDMNWGEFIHFWSGAANANLKAQATLAFGWPAEWETQFVQAQHQFPFPYSNTGSNGNDITNLGGSASAQYTDSPAAEGIANLIDNNHNTKYLTFHNTAWVQYSATTNYTVDRYSITAANDSPTRDPLNWTLQGSTNGTTWTTIDTRNGEDFPYRYQKRVFTFTNSTAYRYYRLNLTNNSGTILQLAEIEFFEKGTAVAAASKATTPITSVIYPNPSADKIVVKFEGTQATLTVTDNQGYKVIPTTPVVSGEAINLSHLKGGTYFIHLNIDGTKKTERFLKK
jgi:hypothetical protein